MHRVELEFTGRLRWSAHPTKVQQWRIKVVPFQKPRAKETIWVNYGLSATLSFFLGPPLKQISVLAITRQFVLQEKHPLDTRAGHRNSMRPRQCLISTSVIPLSDSNEIEVSSYMRIALGRQGIVLVITCVHR